MAEGNKLNTKIRPLYHYLISNSVLFLTPLLFFALFNLPTLGGEDILRLLSDHFKFKFILCSSLLVLLATFYFRPRPRNIYLLNFACYKPDPSLMCSIETFLKINKAAGSSDENLAFQQKVVQKSGLGEKTYFPDSIIQIPASPFIEDARREAEMLMFGAIDDLLAKTYNMNVNDIGILVVNCSLFNPTPSLATKVHPNCYALVVSAECATLNGYVGNNRSMLVPNCIFRIGGTAILLPNRSSDSSRSNYQLDEIVRTHKGDDNKSHNSVFQQEDDNKNIGINLSKDLIVVAGDALKTNIKKLGPLFLPTSELILFMATIVGRRIFKMKIKQYVTDFTRAFEHFCVHPGGKTVLDAVEKNLGLTKWHMEPSRMTFYRFGNNSSCSVWYELAYSEAKGRIRKGDRVWQIAFGSGFKCNSAVWRALRTIDPAKEKKNPWMDEIHEFPVQVS